MSGWHAVVPIKSAGQRKTRLLGQLTGSEIEQLTERMLHHVLTVLAQSGSIEHVTLLSPHRPAGWAGEWAADGGGGLNAEIGKVTRTIPTHLLVIHADLPMVQPADIDALVAAAADGAAIAPDRHDLGTNALALAATQFARFAFGPDSLARHRALYPNISVLRRPGFGLDIDVPADLAAAGLRRCGQGGSS